MSKVWWVGVWWAGWLLGVAAAEAAGQGVLAKAPGPGNPVQVRPATTLPATTLPAATLPTATSSVLVSMQARAAVIFAGHVVSVDREDAAGYVDVRFRVDEAVRGCNKLGVYVLREWAGFWSGGAARYRVGQRLLMLLPARGAGGMSAPVDGMDGAIPIVASAAEPLADAKGVAAAEDGLGGGDVTAMTADLRWVGMHATRSVVYEVTANVVGGLDTGDWAGPITPLVAANGALQPNVGTVLTLLRGGAAGGGGSAHEER